jgi:hypothetical protein
VLIRDDGGHRFSGGGGGGNALCSYTKCLLQATIATGASRTLMDFLAAWMAQPATVDLTGGAARSAGGGLLARRTPPSCVPTLFMEAEAAITVASQMLGIARKFVLATVRHQKSLMRVREWHVQGLEYGTNCRGGGIAVPEIRRSRTSSSPAPGRKLLTHSLLNCSCCTVY